VPPHDEPKALDGPRWSWFQIAVVAIVIAVGLAVSLAVVAAVQGADLLSTVALALAVMAFSTQILVFVADTWTTSRLNAETHGLLQELRTRVQGTEKTLNKQVDKLTDHLFQNVGREFKSHTEDPERFRERIRNDVRGVLSEVSSEQQIEAVGHSDAYEEPELSKADEAILAKLESLPDEGTGKKSLELLSTLSPIAVGSLKDFARDELRSRAYGSEPGMYLRPDHPFTDELIDRGLVQLLRTDEEGDIWAGLTDAGRELSRLMIAPLYVNEIPRWLKEIGSAQTPSPPSD
jgi:hypothetical protein